MIGITQLNPARPLQSLTTILRQVNGRELVFNSRINSIAISSSDDSVLIYRRIGGNWRQTNSISSKGGGRSLCWSQDGSTLGWITNDDNSVAFLRVNDGTRLTIPISHADEALFNLSLSPDGRFFATSSITGVFLGKVDNKTFRKYKTNYGYPTSLEFVGNAQLLVGDRSLRIRPLSMHGGVTVSKNSFLAATSFAPDFSKIAVLTFNGTIKIVSVNQRRIKVQFHSGKGYPCALTWSTDGKYLACELCSNHKEGDPDWYNRVEVFNANSGRLLDTCKLEDSDIGNISFDPNARRIYVFSLRGYSRYWDFSNKRH